MTGKAKELVAAVTGGELLDMKFSLRPSGAAVDEVLSAAKEWVAGAEADIAAGDASGRQHESDTHSNDVIRRVLARRAELLSTVSSAIAALSKIDAEIYAIYHPDRPEQSGPAGTGGGPGAVPTISEPDQPGAFAGDLWFGHPIIRGEATHRWDGHAWHRLPVQPQN